MIVLFFFSFFFLFFIFGFCLIGSWILGFEDGIHT